ncbi:MAG: hypothetical protein WA584_11190 [Pyrinomonadaceae bacterium]
MFQSNKAGNHFPVALCLAALLLLNSACEPAPSMVNKATPATVEEVAEKLNDVQREVKDMQEAGFDIIYVLKRKDGGVFDKEDKQYLKANSPDINRRVLTADEKVFIAGSNYTFSLENVEALQKRFIFEDYSKPGIPQPQPANNASNSNQSPKNSNNQKNVNKR